MMKNLRNIVILLMALVLVVLMLSRWWSDEKQGVLIVGVSADYPPFEFLQDGQVVGFDVALVKKIGEVLDKQIEIKEMPFSSLIETLQKDSIDMIVSSVSLTDERRKNMDFSDQYYGNKIAILFKQAKTKISSIADIRGKKVGVQVGSILEMFLENNKSKLGTTTVVALNNSIDLMQALETGGIDVLMIDFAQAQEFKKSYTGLDFIDFHYKESDGFAIAFKRGSKLVQSVNQALQKLKDTGWIEELKKDYGLNEGEGYQDQDSKNVKTNSADLDQAIAAGQESSDSSQVNEVILLEEDAEEFESPTPFVASDDLVENAPENAPSNDGNDEHIEHEEVDAVYTDDVKQ